MTTEQKILDWLKHREWRSIEDIAFHCRVTTDEVRKAMEAIAHEFRVRDLGSEYRLLVEQ